MRISVLALTLLLTACGKGEKINNYYAGEIVDSYIASQKIKNPKEINSMLQLFKEKIVVPYSEFMTTCIKELEASPSDMSAILMQFREVMPLTEKQLLKKYPTGEIEGVTESAFNSYFEIQNKCFVNQELFTFN